MTDDSNENRVYALDLPEIPFMIDAEYLQKTGDLEEKRGLYWDEQCFSIAEEVTDTWNLGLSRFNRLSMKILYYLYQEDKELLENIMEEMWNDI